MKRDKPSKVTQSDDQPEEQVKVVKDHSNASDVCSSIADSVSQKITSLVNVNFVKPFTCSLVDRGISGLTAGLNERIEEQITSFKCERRTEFLENKDKDNRVPDEFKQAHKDEKVMQNVQQGIEDFANDEQVGLQHMGSVSDACGCAIKVLDEDGNLVRTIGDTSSGKIVEVRYKDGHYSSPDGTDPPGSTKPNDCIYNVIADQLGEKDPQKIADLRTKTVEAMHKNSHIIAHHYADVQYLKIHDRKVLHEGGIVNPTKQSVKDFAKKFTDPSVLEGAGTYKELNDKLKKESRDGIVEVHHEPPDASYDGKSSQKLCVVMDYDDHQNLLSTGSPAYVEAMRNVMSQDTTNGFSDALLIGCIDMHLTSLKSGNGEYGSDMAKLVDGHAKNGKISQEQATILKEKIKAFPSDAKGFTSDYLKENHADVFKNATFKSADKSEVNVLSLLEAKVKDEKVKVYPIPKKRSYVTYETHRKHEGMKKESKREYDGKRYKANNEEKQNKLPREE